MLAGALCLQAEVIDRVAVTVDKIVITESDILHQMRIAAFLNGEPLTMTREAKRAAARQLVEQVLVRREMEISRYPAPEMAETDALAAKLKAERFPNEDGYGRALADYGLDETGLRENLLLQLTVLRFVEFRFRPGVTVSDEDVQAYYDSELLRGWREQDGPPPELDDTRDRIEEILIQQRVNDALDGWLTQAGRQAAIRYREEAFE
ncbi:MAG: hypothetical protein GY953_05610 [bacterium]|nr:hypothetical protein [bacterium]